MAKVIDPENEKQYLLSLIENAAKNPNDAEATGKAEWAKNTAASYAQQFPGFNLDKTRAPSAVLASPSPTYGSNIERSDGQNGIPSTISNIVLTTAAAPGVSGTLSWTREAVTLIIGTSYLAGVFRA